MSSSDPRRGARPEGPVLVTGARGFIGRALQRLAAESGEKRLVGVDVDDADLRDEAAVTRLLRETRPERIVHLAGVLVKGEDPSVLEQQWSHTFEAGAVLVRCAAAAKVRHLVMAGTADELGDSEGVLGPGTVAEPLSSYGLCKSLLREYAAYFARTRPVRVDWFRPFVVYGPGQKAGQMLIPTAFRAARAGEPATFTDGLQTRDFIHVEDVGRWILRAVRVPLPEPGGGFHVHHLGTGEAVPVRSVLEAIKEEFPGARFEFGARPRRPGEPLVQISCKYAVAEAPLDEWKPLRSWREGIAEAAAWWRALEGT